MTTNSLLLVFADKSCLRLSAKHRWPRGLDLDEHSQARECFAALRALVEHAGLGDVDVLYEIPRTPAAG